MRKVRNAVIIIILCIIGAYKAYKPAQLSLVPPTDMMRDAVAGNPTRASRPGLRLSNSNDDQFRDSVAGSGIPGRGNGPRGNTEDQTPPPPRGGDHHGVGPQGSPNPGSQLPPPPSLSPSGPQDETPPQQLE